MGLKLLPGTGRGAAARSAVVEGAPGLRGGRAGPRPRPWEEF
jgi:hypothetical protein